MNPDLKSKTPEKTKKKLKLSGKRLTFLLFALLFAIVGGIIVLRSFAAEDIPNDPNEIVLQYIQEQPTVVSKDANGTVSYIEKASEVQVTGDGTIYCDKQKVLNKGILGRNATANLVNSVKDTGIESLNDNIAAGETLVNSNSGIVVNTRHSKKKVFVYSQDATPAKFTNAANKIAQACSKANTKVDEKERPTNKKAKLTGAQKSVWEKFSTRLVPKANAAALSWNDEVDQYQRINAARANNGRSALGTSECLAKAARAWSQLMAATNSLVHSDLVALDQKYCDSNWTVLGENIGVGPSSGAIFDAFVASPHHWANIIDSRFQRMGVGAYLADTGRLWITQEFATCGSCGGPWAAAAASPVPVYQGRLDTFVKGTNGHLWHKWFDGYSWSGWEDLGGSLASGPTVASWAKNRLDVFAQNSSGYLIHKWWDGYTWSGWETFTDGVIASDPDAVSWGPNRIDIVARSSGNKLMHKWYDGYSWHKWETFTSDPSFLSSPTITTWGSGRLDVFVRGTDSKLYQKFFANSAWSGWTPLGGTTYNSPDAVSWFPGRIDLFVQGTDTRVWHKYFANGWSGWESLGGSTSTGPSVASRGPGQLDLFARGANDNILYHKWYGNGSWSGWESLGGTLASDPDAVSWH